MKIYLPHINYTVHVLTLKKGPFENTKAYTEKGANGRSCAVYLPKKPTPSLVAHELMHVIRYICKDRHMDFLLEEEHLAYTMQYLMGRVLGYEYIND